MHSLYNISLIIWPKIGKKGLKTQKRGCLESRRFVG